jgi:hypothetical protein
MIGIYICIFIILLIILYLVIIHIRDKNNNELTINDKLNIINIKENIYIELDETKLNETKLGKTNINNNNIESDNINMESLDDIGNIYDDYYNNIDYTDKINPYDNNYKPIELNKLKECQVPTLNTEQCYKSRYYECPIVNGSFLQCTNNYIPKPTDFNGDCGNRTFDMTPYPWKISENCYYNKIGFDRKKEFNPIQYK